MNSSFAADYVMQVIKAGHLPEHDDQMLCQLLVRAIETSFKAYAPYSKFYVGAAVQTTVDSPFWACNVENASYGLTICAERAAIFKAVAKHGPNVKIKRVVIYAASDKPAAPCGACRQVIKEFADGNCHVISYGEHPEHPALIEHIDDLLPHAFELGDK